VLQNYRHQQDDAFRTRETSVAQTNQGRLTSSSSREGANETGTSQNGETNGTVRSTVVSHLSEAQKPVPPSASVVAGETSAYASGAPPRYEASGAPPPPGRQTDASLSVTQKQTGTPDSRRVSSAGQGERQATSHREDAAKDSYSHGRTGFFAVNHVAHHVADAANGDPTIAKVPTRTPLPGTQHGHGDRSYDAVSTSKCD
jgi:hypothetical protein